MFEINPRRFCLIAKFWVKKKSVNLGPQIPDFGIFWLEFLKTIVLFKISTFEFVKLEFLNHSGNFDIGSAFSKGAKFAFSEGPGAHSGPLYKVCLIFLSLV